MHDRLDEFVSPPGSGIRRRTFARYMAAECLLLSACAARGEPVGPELRRALREFEEMVFAASLLDLDARAAFVNVAINRCVDFAPDPESASGGDEWSTPFETLARGTGDCDDFAIAKFYLLVASGAPRAGVRLLYAIYRWPDRTARPLPHLVTVAGWPLTDPCVLDCINPLTVPLSQRDDLEPVFSFDELSVWAGVEPTPLSGRRRHIDRWQRTQARMLRQARQAQYERKSICPTFTEAPTARSTACIDRRRAMPASSSTAPTRISSAF